MNEIQNRQIAEDEIDLIQLLKKVFKEKKLIFKCSIIAAIAGVAFALFQPNQYTSSTTFIPQLSSDVKTGSSSLSGLASLAGINLGGIEGSSEFPPTLYPQVVESVPFRLELLSSNIQVNNEELTLRDYFLENKNSFNFLGTVKKYTIGLPSLILGLFKADEKFVSDSSSIYSLTKEDNELFRKLSEFFSLSINDKEGFISMSFTDENKKVSAQVVQTAQTLLQNKIIEFKVKSSKELLDFTSNQYNEKKKAFEKLQDERAVFVDNNINISSSLFQNKLSRIESELSIAQNVVQQLASQVEQAKLQVNKNTPVFTTIKPVSVPFERSSPKRAQIVIISIFLGFIISSGYVLLKEPLIEIIKSIKS
ncbi:MAG: exopolysaccharide biosynthesis protein [Flavobacteriales bacterium]|nr:MAG: exopolysaccharide biosynthesis protein [Flavobacteriales bacterium]